MKMKIYRQQIIEAVRLEDVVQRYTNLYRGSKSGKTKRGKCLFHKDRGNALRINVTEQIYECDVCKERGDVIHFVQTIIGCKEFEAIRMLAEWYHIPVEQLENFTSDTEEKRKKESVSRLFSIHQEREFYFILRSLSFCQCNNPIFVYAHKLLELGVSPTVLPDTYSHISGRMLFPVRNGEGVLQGFVQYMGGKDQKRSVCYPKDLVNRHLLGLYHATDSIKKYRFVYLVWNNKDLLIMHTIGFTNTVACCEEELSFVHVRQLLYYINQVVIVYTEEIYKQVRTMKAAARLSFHGAEIYYFPLSQKLSSIFLHRQTKELEYFIRQSTRLIFLEKMKDYLFLQLEKIELLLNEICSFEEKLELRAKQFLIRKKVDKLSILLEKNWQCLYKTNQEDVILSS